jgi:pSer/pThr/pTyr-binding forkhead associated (FHA) protein
MCLPLYEWKDESWKDEMANALRFKHTNAPRQSGELARLKVIQGPDFGAVYVLTGPKVSIGRGEENDIVISDLKASRNHAEVFTTTAGWMIKDKGSSNGILFNGKATREAKLKINDTVTMGETTLEFTTSEVGTMMLVAPPRTMAQVQAEQKLLQERQEKMGAMGLAGLFGAGSASSPGPPQAGGGLFKNKRALAIIGVGVVLFFVLGDENKPAKPAGKKQDSDAARDLAAYLPNNPEVGKASETLFKDGLREYFLGNYNRARTQFETVLQISPGHAMATLYLENCDLAVKNEVKVHLEYGKKSSGSGKLRDARAHYERVMRLLHKDQTNPAYIEAKEQFEKVLKEIRGEVKDK